VRARTTFGLTAVALALAGCSSAVRGVASPAGFDSGDVSGDTVTCDWTPVHGGAVVDADRPPSDVPADGKAYLRMTTGQGSLVLALDRSAAPCAAQAMVTLAQQRFFDGTTCHRETDTAGLQVLQCGDPTGTGTGGPPWRYPTDVDGSETYPRGTVAMANSGQGFDGSQFFLVWGEAELPPSSTVVGTVDPLTLAVLDTIAANGNDGSNGPGDGAPNQPVTITSMTVGG
jgi:peptidyl-prolyl cis-trans isomerase B (cyclophilin B)